MKKAIHYFWSLSTLVGILLVVIGANFADSVMHLKPPGLRLISEPETIIPATDHYLNQKRGLPRYRRASGTLLKGWSRQFVKTRRFSSNQSAWVYYRTTDLTRTQVISTNGVPKKMRIWPPGTTLILEGYKGDASRIDRRNLLEIVVMTKTDKPDLSAQPLFYPVNWSYARFTPDGNPSLPVEKLKECHRCHSIAFQLTGDLIFSTFP